MTSSRPWPEIGPPSAGGFAPLLGVLRSCKPWVRGAIGGLVALRVLQAWTLAGAGIAFADAGPTTGVAIATLVVGIGTARGALRTFTVDAVRRSFVGLAADSVCSASALATGGNNAPQLELRMFRALYAACDLWTELLPNTAANVLTIATIGPLLATRVPGSWCIAGIIGGSAAIATHLIASRAHGRRIDRTLAEERRLTSQVAMLLQGHIDIVSSGDAATHAARTASLGDAWSAAFRSTEWTAAWTARLPAMVLAAAALVAWFALDAANAPPWVGIGHLLVAGSLVPALTGLAAGAVKSRPALNDLAEFASLLRGPTDPGWPDASTPSGPSVEARSPITMEGVSFAYAADATPVVRDLTFRWEKGEILGIAGPNGSGKSTVLRLLLRLADPTSGRVTVGGIDLAAIDATAWRRQIGYVPQRAYLPSEGTVREALAVLAPAATDAAHQSALARVGLTTSLRSHWPDELEAPVAALSSGERQRLCVARVLAGGRLLLLLDEPDANLDADGRTQLIALLRELKATHRILVVAHDEAVLAVADRLLHLAPDPAGAASTATPS